MGPQQASRAEEGPPDARVGRPETLRVWLLGGFRVSVGTRTVEEGEWRLRKAASLVKLLALAPGHHLHREQAMDLLWSNLGRKAAANNLSQALHAARRALAPEDAKAASCYLASQGQQLLLCPGGELWLDVEAFEEAAATARRSREPAAHRAALNLYAGELLPRDPYEDWAEVRREGLQQSFLALLVELASLHEERGEHGPGIEALRRAVVEEPTREEAHIGLMRLYALGGRQAEALAQYARLEESLSRELGAEPQAASRDLREEIATGRFPPPHRPFGPPKGGIKDPHQHNLPATRSSFVGREREIGEVKRALSMTRLLTLTGAGGSGKTRLALEVARDLVGAYPDGVWMVELAPLSEGALVSQAVAQALRVRERPGVPLTDTLSEDLRAKQALVVLDNCEHLVEAVARVADVLLDACPDLRIIATSREGLGISGELQWQVSPLSVPDPRQHQPVVDLERYESVRLFAERARYRNPAFALTLQNAPSVAEICKRLDGIPLAIELAAARIGLSVDQIASRLDDSLRLLSMGSRTATVRQRTLRGALDWSYDLLSGRERALFTRLSVFAGGWTLEAAEKVASGESLNENVIFDLLSGLVDKSLVAAGATGKSGVRYRMLEPLRQYAIEKLVEAGEIAVIRRRHAEFCVVLAEEAEPQLLSPTRELLDRLEAEHDNFRAVFSWVLERGEAELGMRLAGALRWFWFARGHLGEGRKWLKELLRNDCQTAARVKALLAMSWLAFLQNDYDVAEEAAEEGLELGAKTEVEDKLLAELMNNLGSAVFMRGDDAQATKLYEEALRVSREAGDTWGLSFHLNTLGTAHMDRGDYDQATEALSESLALSRQLGDVPQAAMNLGNLGYIALNQGDYERATALGEEAAMLLRQQSHTMGLDWAHWVLGLAALLRGDLDKARASHEECLALRQKTGGKTGVVDCLEALACSAAAQGGRAEHAAKLFGAAHALSETIDYRQPANARALREPYLAAASSQLDEVTWEAAFAEGRAMELEEAVEYALSEDDSSMIATRTPEQTSTTVHPSALTRREREVARLVARDLTNRRVAEELVLSERTVENHVSNILKKLNLSSRSEVAAWVEAL